MFLVPGDYVQEDAPTSQRYSYSGALELEMVNTVSFINIAGLQPRVITSDS